MARLGDICDILDNKRVPITASNRLAGPYPYYGANGVQDYVADYIFDDELVLLAEDGGNFGSKDKPIAYRVSGKCWVNNHAHVLKPKEGLDVDYLCYSLMFYDVTGLVNGATRQKLTQADMRKMEIPLPPLDEQRKIAAVLDKVSDLIAKRRQQLDKLDMLVKARFVEMFGAFPKDIELSEVATITGGLTKNSNRKNLPLKLPYLRVANVAFNSVDVSEILEIGLTEEERKKTLLQKGDLLFVEGNGSPDQIGRVAVWNNQITPCVHQNHLIKARFDNSIVLPAFALHYYMNSEGRQQIREKAVSTSGLYTLSVSKIESLVLPTPPMELQEQFSTFVEQTDKSKLSIQKSCEKLETLKKALMQQYFG